jgi:hypothetical protein
MAHKKSREDVEKEAEKPTYFRLSTSAADMPVACYEDSAEWLWKRWCWLKVKCDLVDGWLTLPVNNEIYSHDGEITTVSLGAPVINRQQVDESEPIWIWLSIVVGLLTMFIPQDASGRDHTSTNDREATKINTRMQLITITLTDGQVLEFLDVGSSSFAAETLSHETYFQSLPGRRIKAAGYKSHDRIIALAMVITTPDGVASGPDDHIYVGHRSPHARSLTYGEAVVQRSASFGNGVAALATFYCIVAAMVLFFGVEYPDVLPGSLWLPLPIVFVVPIGKAVGTLLRLAGRAAMSLPGLSAPDPPMPTLEELLTPDHCGAAAIKRLLSYDGKRLVPRIASLLQWPAGPVHAGATPGPYAGPWSEDLCVAVALCLTLLGMGQFVIWYFTPGA